MANTQSGKGNPASKRMQNKNLQARRARSWAKNNVAKKKRIAEAQAAFEANEVYRAIGEPTPYELRRQVQRVLYETNKA